MSGSISGLSPVSTFLIDEKDEAESAATYTKTDATTESNVTTFEKDAVSITSAADLMSNYKALGVVLGAYGLGSIQNETALVKDLLTQNPTSSTSLAKSSGNAAWLKFAEAFSDWNETASGSTPTSQPFADSSTVDTITTDYEESAYETSLDSDNSGIGNALYFTRNMTSDMTLTDIMSNSSLLTVVETVSGYDPTEFGALSYDQQVRMLTSKVDLSDFSTPEKIKNYAEQYLATLQISPQTTTAPATILSLYGGDSTSSILDLFGVSSGTSTSSLLEGLF